MKKKAVYPTKTSMNLFYKPDRTTKPATAALYALFALVCLLALAKWLVLDLWMEKQAAQREMMAAQAELDSVMLQLSDFDEVQKRYFRYSATDEEQVLVDRMEVLSMLDGALGNAKLDDVDISAGQVQVQLSNVTLAQVAGIVSRLEASPLVSATIVNTAATTRDTYVVGLFGETLVDEADWDQVQANILIQLVNRETEQTEEAQQG